MCSDKNKNDTSKLRKLSKNVQVTYLAQLLCSECENTFYANFEHQLENGHLTENEYKG